MDLSNLSMEELKAKISENSEDALNHYYLAKKMFGMPLTDDIIKEIEDYLNNAIKLAPKLYMAHYYLGRLYFIQKQFDKAEKEFSKVLKYKPEDLLAKEYLNRCGAVIKSPSHTSRTSIRDIFYHVENDIRCFNERELTKNHGEDWLRNTVHHKIRASCAARREEGLENERNSNLINFANFNDYNVIIGDNKSIFTPYLINLKLWQNRLKEIEPIRNAIAHSRDVTESAEKKVREYYKEFKRSTSK